ncbi:MAG: AAA family ATPase, partial [Thermomicrobiales bacterium]
MKSPTTGRASVGASSSPRGAASQLPRPLTSLLGRECAIAEVLVLLQQPGLPLLTLTGPGGVGKTRLALAVAAAWDTARAPVVFVSLAAVRDAALVGPTLARALGSSDSAASLPEALAAGIGDGPLLLIVDNVEHVLPAALLIATLLQACPRLTVLATSRAPLHVSGEREYPVTPLPLPAPDAVEPRQIVHAPAVRLFMERAGAVCPGFALTAENAAAVAAICARLDGLPLAIELAAARSKHLPPALLLARLARRLPLLVGGPRDAPERLQTMAAAIAWSHALLTPLEQVVFRRLAVFSGGFTLAAA